ncbi:transport and Golgi organization protein 11 isoform X2 [Bombus vosnesenskii]|uniref:Transport and Golgi organization protein 11 isoform X2 n=2 Tax=Pyrobombus TaxID=144703 RepID=A0A6J3KC93_9HYME|nr:transport and Golgi organization protein 11 isoform X2 [Bombus impatiens]XP_033350071.1 transport and Golgi organization protein 11 isoform X2 [Bombus vosnesenskii]XP_050477359.1 transport and Golgi organization protein 11 isoform X2 [Bombus huntii]
MTYLFIMSKAHSPTVFNGEADNFYDPNFTLDINKRMRVPKSIRVSGDYTDEEIADTNGSSWNQIVAGDKFEMHVPDRILVVGQEQHVGTRAPPREITLENAVLPPEAGMVRVQTPPRILTLDDHYFPAVDEEEPNSYPTETKDSLSSKSHGQYSTETQIVREQTPSYSALNVSLPPSEEIQHLRRQVGKLNRRVMAIELEMLQRQQREKILYALTLTYLILKAFSWLTRN